MNKSIYDVLTTWQDQVFTKATPLSCANHLQEEIKELIQSIESGNADPVEVVDCLFLLMNIAHKMGLRHQDLVVHCWDKMLINMQRKWGEPNDQGYVKHIDQPTTTTTV